MSASAYTDAMATTTQPPPAASRVRYRGRTWLRGILPTPLQLLAPKGAQDCGAHEFYNHDGRVDRCYHCTFGERPHDPAPLSPEACATLERAAAAGSAAANDMLTSRQ